ncbi:MAG TPA: 6-carboxytetrahydropterin synthase [Candidatus Binatia bacterium]|jgi:6-pyruvoyltetrahydropterin/6-carboxytetrahydropterin synthase|nr:6-carboxytetrahydropterin synthase [Candidatus Binatia bacterium]
MITATRRIQFAAGHRVFGHEGKCRYLHGHNFVALVTAAADDLDAVGRVIDFGVLKERIGGWIERAWDHGFIVWQDDAEARRALEAVEGQKTYLLAGNPTAENLADHLLRVVGPDMLAGTGVRLVKVTLHETENGIAEATL